MADALVSMTPVSSGTVPGGGAWDLYKVFSNELVDATADVDSVFGNAAPGMELGQFRSFGLYIVLTGTTPNILFQLVQSFNNTAANFAVPDVDGDIVTITDTAIHQVVARPTQMPYVRIRANGQAGNGADVRVTAYIWVQT